MKISIMLVSFTLVAAIGPFSHNASAGGIGGGGPPSHEVENLMLMRMNEGALNGDIFRVTQPGLGPIIMLPRKASISEHRISAVNSETDAETIFFAKSNVEIIQDVVGKSIARTILSMTPGVLPIESSDLAPDVTPKVEIIPASELDKTR